MSEITTSSTMHFDEDAEIHESILDSPAIAIAEEASLIYQSFGGFLELLMIIAFIFILVFNKIKSLQGFILLLLFGFVADFIALACYIVCMADGWHNTVFINASEISYIYVIISGSLWNTILSLNRCIAVLWPMKHLRLWTTKNICVYCIPVILLYPLLLQGYIFFDDRFYVEGLSIFSAVTNFFYISRLIVGLSNTILAMISLIMTIIVYLKNQSTSIKLNSRWDLNMLLHSAFSSLFLFLFSLCYWLAALFYPESKSRAFICEYLGILMFAIFHYGSIVILLVVNSSIRKAVINFYTFGKCYSDKNVTMVISVSKITVTSHRRHS